MSDRAVRLSGEERMKISAVVHQNYYMPDVFAVVEGIIGERMPEATIVTEYNVIGAAGLRFGINGTTLDHALASIQNSNPPGQLVKRPHTEFSPVITDWQPCDDHS